MTTTQDTAVVVQPKAQSVAFSQAGGLAMQSFDDLWRMAKAFSASDLVPKDYKDKPENALVAMQMGAEVGLKPLQALQGIAVVNGRPSLWGDALWALVQASPLVQDVRETFDERTMTATCLIHRKGRGAPTVVMFSKEDATKAGLWAKTGLWLQYPKRMLQMRARAFAARDALPDVLKGVQVAEEVMDIPPEKDMGMVDDAIEAVNALLALKPVSDAGKGAKDSRDAKGGDTEQNTAPQGKPAPKAEADGNALTYAEVRGALEKAKSADTLDIAADLIGSVSDPGQRAELSVIAKDIRAKLA